MKQRAEICVVAIFLVLFSTATPEISMFGRQKVSISKVFLTRHNHLRSGPHVSQMLFSPEEEHAYQKDYLRQKTEGHTVEINEDRNNWTTYIEDWEPSSQVPQATPNPNSCLHRPVHWLIEGRFKTPHVYANFSSLKQFQYKNGTAKLYTWLQAKNICRRYCMTLLGFEEEYEWEMIKIRTNSTSDVLIWTSGRICDYSGCEDKEYLKPLIVNGWSWSGTKMSLSPTNSTPKGWITQPWYSGDSSRSHEDSRGFSSHHEVPGGGSLRLNRQPDNLVRDIYGNGEQCLAVVKSSVLGSEPYWFDMLCSRRGHVICEENISLVREADARWPEFGLLSSWPSV